jgi:hypothetical protein
MDHQQSSSKSVKNARRVLKIKSFIFIDVLPPPPSQFQNLTAHLEGTICPLLKDESADYCVDRYSNKGEGGCLRVRVE